MAELHSQARLARQSSARGAAAPSTPSFSSAAASAAATTTAEADLAKATARIDELEQLLEDAEIENQHLTEQLEEVLTAGRAGPGSVGSVAEEAQSPLPYGAGPGHVAAGHTGASSNPYSYGHAATLTLSALEQRLAMAEARRDELAAALEEAAVVNRRLEEELAAGRQQPAAALRRGDSADRQVSAWGEARAVLLAESVFLEGLRFCRTGLRCGEGVGNEWKPWRSKSVACSVCKDLPGQQSTNRKLQQHVCSRCQDASATSHIALPVAAAGREPWRDPRQRQRPALQQRRQRTAAARKPPPGRTSVTDLSSARYAASLLAAVRSVQRPHST